MTRHALAEINVPEMRGLEIGPLASPVVKKADGEVYYIDHASRLELQAKYANDSYMSTRLEDIVDVDYVLAPGQSLSDTVGKDAPFDYVIASHLIEHIPDMVSWLAEVASLLSIDGILSLVIPDKRYTFDINRSVTETADIVDAHLRRLTRPSSGQIYDFFTRAINGIVDCSKVWEGTADYSNVVRADCEDPYLVGYEWCQAVLNSDEFVDIHCHVFTPGSFLDLLEELVRLRLIDFEVAGFFPTEYRTVEFHVSLRKGNPHRVNEAWRGRQLRSVSMAREIVLNAEAALHVAESNPEPSIPEPSIPESSIPESTIPADTTETTEAAPDEALRDPEISDLEWRMILAKRYFMQGIRTTLSLFK